MIVANLLVMERYSPRAAAASIFGLLLLGSCVYLPQLLAYSPSPDQAIAGALWSVGLWSVVGRRCFVRESPLGTTSGMVVLGNAGVVTLATLIVHSLF
jgi:hypothetical protein